MSTPLRDDASRSPLAESPRDRDARIEQLLLAGLDHYFAGEHERAVHVWTRVLFVDRTHARARAYIERARSALAERQRQGDELLHHGAAAFDRGDVAAARDLLTEAVARGAGTDEACAFLDRIDRLELPAAAAPAPGKNASDVIRPALERAPDGPAPPPSRARGRWMGLGFVVLIAAAVALFWDRLGPWLTIAPPAGSPAAAAIVEDPIPVPRVAELALGRARALVARGHLKEALRRLEAVGPSDPLRPEADLLRAAIQRALLTGTLPEVTRSAPIRSRER